MKRMLFNATHQEELRVAIVDGQELLDLDIEATTHNQRKGNIYKGRITRVEPSLEAAFVEYGTDRQGFLPMKEVSRVHFQNYDSSTPISATRIQDVLKVGQELIVQVEKDERGNKGAALSTFVSLAGRFLVLMPDNPKGGGISRRISGEDRQDLRDSLSALDVPKGHALIARTAGIGRNAEEMKWDFEFLTKIWDAISAAAKDRPAPFLIYQENNLVIRSLRDHLRPDIVEIVIDDDEIYQRALRFMQMTMPHNVSKLKHYSDTVPLFSRYQIENQIEQAYSRLVTMQSGAQLIIEQTEALVTIDVNSAKATSGGDIEETALKTNLEAVEEIAKQLRIRDMGGLIVIDLIDMLKSANQRAVEKRLQESLKVDRARVQVGRISRFGLLEMSRQRLRSAIGEANYIKCPRCEGNGMIRSVPSSALSILRIIEEEALKENTEAVHAHLPLETAAYLLNEKRHEVTMIEQRLATRIVLIPSSALVSPNYTIQRLKAEDISRDKLDVPSYKLKTLKPDIEGTYEGYQQHALQQSQNQAKASVSLNDLGQTPPPSRVESAPVASPVERKGFIDKIKVLFSGPETTQPEKDARPAAKKPVRQKTKPAENQAKDQSKDKEATNDNQQRPRSRTRNNNRRSYNRRPSRKAQSQNPNQKTAGQKQNPNQKTAGQKQNPNQRTAGQKQNPNQRTAGQKQNPNQRTSPQRRRQPNIPNPNQQPQKAPNEKSD